MNLIMELLDSLHNCGTNTAQCNNCKGSIFYLAIFIRFILLIKIFI
jgi:hypothetical protein